MYLIEKGPRYYVTEEMVKEMKKGSIIVDISIDQGDVSKHQNAGLSMILFTSNTE